MILIESVLSFQVVDHTPVTLRAGASASLLHLRLRAAPPDAFSLSSELTVFTNLSEYTVPIRMYSGKLLLVSTTFATGRATVADRY